MSKRLLAFLLAFVMIFGNVTPALSASPTDQQDAQLAEGELTQSTVTEDGQNSVPLLAPDLTIPTVFVSRAIPDFVSRATPECVSGATPECVSGATSDFRETTLTQLRNTDLVVETVGGNNPTGLGGKIKVGGEHGDVELDIPANSDPVETIDPRLLNGELTFTLEGTENGVLVDNENNKVYVPGEFEVDPNGLENTKLTFTEKPLVTTTDPNDTDNYVKVDFTSEYGDLERDTEYWVYKGVNVTLVAPNVNMDNVTGRKFAGWDPEVAERAYTVDTTHKAQFDYDGKDFVPQPDPDKKPDVPDNFVLVEFLPGEQGTLTGTTMYWVNPDANIKLADVTKPGVTANDGWKFTGWDKEDTTKITGAVKVTSQYDKTDAQKVTDLGELSPETIKVRVGDQIDWSKGVALVEANETSQAYLDKATVTDLSNRNSETAIDTPYTGDLKVVFEDGSELTVKNQDLYVWDEKTEINENNKDNPRPEDASTITFAKGDGITEITPADKTLIVKTGTDITIANDFPTATPDTDNDYKDKVVWKDGDTALGEKVTVDSDKTFTATAEEMEKSETPTVNPPKENDGTITGTGKPGSSVDVELPDGTIITGTVNPDGSWEVEVPEGTELKPNDKITVTQKEEGKKSSDPVETEVTGKDEPKPQPLVDPKPEEKPEKPQDNWLIGGGYIPRLVFDDVEDKLDTKYDLYRWYILGDDKGLFNPTQGLTRAEMATIFARALDHDGSVISKADVHYVDETDKNVWYYDALVKTTNAGIFEGTDKNKFEANREITKAELIATIARFQELAKESGNAMNMAPNHWAVAEVQSLYTKGWLDVYTNGHAKFEADSSIVRQEVVSIFNRAFSRPIDRTFIDKHAADLKGFDDVNKDMWAYYEIITASNTFLSKYGVWVNFATEDKFLDGSMIRWNTALDKLETQFKYLEQAKFQNKVR